MALFYIEYGCSQCKEQLIVEANDETDAIDYAYQSAQDSYWSYDCNYIDPDDYPDADEEDLAEIEEQDMETDIFYFAEPYDSSNEEHKEAMREQGNKPFCV